MHSLLPHALGGGLPEVAAQLAVVAGTVVLLLVLVALGGFAYRSLRGDGVGWPDDEDPEPSEDEGVRRGDADDEWDYY